MKSIITIEGKPLALKRPRFSKYNSKVFDSQKKEKNIIEAEIKSQWTKDLLMCPLCINILFEMPIAKSLSQKKKLALEGTPHVQVPDVDNLLKMPLDCMNGIVFKDDCQVYLCLVEKIFSSTPKTTIRIDWDDKMLETPTTKIIKIESLM